MNKHIDVPYQALLIVSFGGPEANEDVIPFLENVLRGRNVPRERLLQVAEHYYHFGGKSPINDQNRELIAKLETLFATEGPSMPIYWGNRNWHPLLPDTLRQMKEDGVERALAFVTSAFSSYSGCRQYRENILHAQHEVGEGAPRVDKLRAFYNHPGFIRAMADSVRSALQEVPEQGREAARVVFTAHSIPVSMANSSRYVVQLEEACRLVMGELDGRPFDLVYQSRSGAPGQPWLEPDVCDHLRSLKISGVSDVVVAPIGFISDHMEVLYDLDTEAATVAREVGLHMVRAATAGTSSEFIKMIRSLVLERVEPRRDREALGLLGPSHDFCPEDCCPAPARRLL
jgi:ferrochelatase